MALAIALATLLAALSPVAAQSVKRSLDDAVKAYDADRFADAEGITRALVTRAPNDMAARLLLGWAVWNQQRYDDALVVFKGVLHDAPSQRRPTWDEYAAFNISRDVAAIDNPHLDQARSGLAWTYLKKGWPRSALVIFERLVSRAPDWDLPYLGRGYARLALGRRAEARADFDAYGTRTKSRALLERALGDFEVAGGRPAAAIAHYERALAMKPRAREVEAELAWARAGGRAPLDRAWALYRAGKPGDAGAAFATLLKASPPLPAAGRVSALNGLGWSAVAMKTYDRAARAFTDSLAAVPGGADATSGLGWVALGRKQWSAAEQTFAKALAAAPGLPSAVDGLAALRTARYGAYDHAWALYWAGKLADARAAFVQLRTTPGELPPAMLPFVRAGVAWADLGLHRPDAADPVFRELATTGGDIGAEATAGLGWVALERQQPGEARQHFATALRAVPEQPAAVRGLAELRKREAPELHAAWAAYTARRYDDAAAAFTRVSARTDLAPHDRADAERGLAWSLTWLGKLDEAVRHFTALVGTTPDADAWYGDGLALTRAGRAREAVEPLRRALALVPASLDVRLALGWALLESGDVNGAGESFAAAHALAPSAAEVARAIAWTRARAGRAGDAVAAFRDALALAPAAVDNADFRALVKTKDYRPLRRELAWAYVRWHGFERARGIFEELVREDRNDGDAHFGLGYTRYRLGQYAEADTDLVRAIAAGARPGPRVVWVAFPEAGAFPILTDAWSIRGWVALLGGHAADARTRFSESLERDPELVSSLGGLGVVLERSNDRAAAHELYARAAEIYPTYPLIVAGLRTTAAAAPAAAR